MKKPQQVADVNVNDTEVVVLRRAVVDVLCGSPPEHIGARLRRGLIDAREPGAHPEDRCEECGDPFRPWMASPTDWETVTGRLYGGPIICRECFDGRLAARRSEREAASE